MYRYILYAKALKKAPNDKETEWQLPETETAHTRTAEERGGTLLPRTHAHIAVVVVSVVLFV